jgi:hypothetical protein
MQSRKAKFGRGFLGRSLRKRNLLPACTNAKFEYLVTDVDGAHSGGFLGALSGLLNSFMPGFTGRLQRVGPPGVSDALSSPVTSTLKDEINDRSYLSCQYDPFPDSVPKSGSFDVSYTLRVSKRTSSEVDIVADQASILKVQREMKQQNN